ncbi:MAG: class II aldolase/adducin family protein [Candidatus Omnitrophota bacterium]
MEDRVGILKEKLMATGKLIWDKNLVTGCSGNLSCRVDDNSFLLTCHDSCLGFLMEKDFCRMDLSGKVLEGSNPSFEEKLHTAIYIALPKTQAIIHTHTSYINAFFATNTEFIPFTFETKLYIGSIRAIPQTTPKVTEIAPVTEALKKNSIAVLQNHGVVAAAEDLKQAFFLVQTLEEAVKMEYLRRIFSRGCATVASEDITASGEKFKLFSREQIEGIVSLVNQDAQVEKMGKDLKLTLTMAVKMEETGCCHNFTFQDGKIVKVTDNPEAEFVISGSREVWQQIFNREIDPFVATTQKKLILKGDFAKLSRWYAPFSRIFELWNQIPIE